MRMIKHTAQFLKDLHRETKGRSVEYVQALKDDLAVFTKALGSDAAPPLHCKDHPLFGKWKRHRDCHVRPDLVLIYRKPDSDTLALVRLGSHAELFG
jgi:mRNA interferase YafQ